MSRQAAEAGFETFVDRTIDTTRREFSVARVLEDTGFGRGGPLVDRLRRNADAIERRVVEPELATYRRRAVEQFRVVLAYVESDDPIEAFEAELLEYDGYVHSIDPAVSRETRRTIVADVRSRLRRLGDGVEPLVRRPEDDFWPAVEAAFDRGTALELVENVFPFTGPLRRHRDAFAFEVRIDPGDVFDGFLAGRLPSVSIDYTDEAIRAMRRAETRVVRETKTEVEARFDDAR